MDFSYFFKILNKNKWLIMLVTLVTTAATYLITNESSLLYRSKAMLATGITESTSPSATIDDVFLQPFKVENQFSNLIEIINSRTVIGLLSRRLALHDLQSDNQFKDLDDLYAKYSKEELERAIELFENKFDAAERNYNQENAYSLSEEDILTDSLGFATEFQVNQAQQVVFGNESDDLFLKDILKIMGYDYESIKRASKVYRVKNTDYILFEYISPSKDLSAYAVNSFCQEFIEYYKKVRAERSDNSVDFFTKLAYEKKKELDRKNNALKEYKLTNRVVNIDEQAKARVSQIRDLEIRREEENKKIPSYRQAIVNIDRYLDESETAYTTQQAGNQRIENLKEQINTLNDTYISTGLSDDQLKSRIDDLKGQLETEITGVASSSAGLSASAQELVAKKFNTEIDLEIAKASVQSIDLELARLGGEVTGFVSKDATISALEREIQVVQDEYLDIGNKLNAAKFASLSSTNLLSQIEYGMPAEAPEPNKTLFLSGFAGMVSLSLCVVLAFVLAYLDTTIKSPDRFKKMTRLPLVGYINQLKFKDLDLEQFFNNRSQDHHLETFKQLLRKIRYEIETNNARRLLVTSAREGEGKTFLILSLAYSLSLTNKRILLVDTNFKNNTLTEMLQHVKQDNLLSNQKLIGENNLDQEFITSGIISSTSHSGIDIIGSKGGYKSPSEIFAGKNFEKLLSELSNSYDYIFLEGSSMNDYSDTQELIDYVDKVVAVFSAGSDIKANDRETIDYLKSLDDKFIGGVLNKVDLKDALN